MERGLGRDAAIKSQHVGAQPDGASGAEVYSQLLGLNQEGPPREEEMFTPANGAVLFTPFSRVCAEEWLRRHGRRFACCRQRADTGSKQQSSRYMDGD